MQSGDVAASPMARDDPFEATTRCRRNPRSKSTLTRLALHNLRLTLFKYTVAHFLPVRQQTLLPETTLGEDRDGISSDLFMGDPDV